MKRFLTCFAAIVFATGACYGQVVNVDLGRVAGETTAAGYNNITEATQATILNSTLPGTTPPPATVLSLVDNAGGGTNYTAGLTLDNIPNDSLGISTGNFAAPTSFNPVAGNFVGTISQSAYEDGLFLRDEDGDEFVTVTFSGFAATDLVSFSLFGSRATNGLETIVSAISGGATQTQSLFPNPTDTANFNPFIGFSNLTADANGDIALEINAPGTSQSGTVNFIQFEVTSVPEPSSAILLAMGGLALVRRRRK